LNEANQKNIKAIENWNSKQIKIHKTSDVQFRLKEDDAITDQRLNTTMWCITWRSHRNFNDRWKEGEPVNTELAESKCKLPRILDESRKEKILEDFKNILKRKEVLRTRCILSEPHSDGIISSLIKLEREKEQRC
jgi:hypothetical protein